MVAYWEERGIAQNRKLLGYENNMTLRKRYLCELYEFFLINIGFGQEFDSIFTAIL
jgi:hypothetical protein